VVVVRSQSNLLEIVAALNPSGGLSDLLDGWQEQADEDANDGNHHQQLDQREATRTSGDTSEWHRTSEKKKKRSRKDPDSLRRNSTNAMSHDESGNRREDKSADCRIARYTLRVSLNTLRQRAAISARKHSN
jgi:hypothetical protein